jgi:hypothetical protein
MLTIVIWSVCFLLLARYFEVKIFLRKVSKICNKYDWKYINENPECLIDKMKDENGYYLTSEWSAYKFLFLNGPSPKQMYLSFKPLTLKNVYNKEVLEKIQKYEIK